MRVVLGGTFDRLHAGHEALLARAFELGDEVFIGLTSPRMAARRRSRRVRPFEERRRALLALLRKRGWSGSVSEIFNPFGRSLEARYDAIVVSPETLARTVGINEERRRRGLKPLKVYTIPWWYGEDGLRLSASRIAAGDIDARGKRRRPLRVLVGSTNAVKVDAVRDAFKRAFPKLRIQVRGAKARSGVPAQPFGRDVHVGARNRAARAMAKADRADYAVGIEAGLVRDPNLKRQVDVQYVSIVDRLGDWSDAHGGGFYYPASVLAGVMKGKTVSAAIGPAAGDRRIGSTIGAIGYLTQGALTRRQLTEQAVLLALAPRIRRALYQE